MEVMPRVMASTMGSHVGKTVMLIGEVVTVQNGSALVRAPDGGAINITFPPGERFEGTFVQVVGRVTPNGQIEALRHQIVSNNFDLDLYKKALEITAQYPNIF